MTTQGMTTEDENRILGVRLSLAEAWVSVLLRAYDALLHYGINYRVLKEFKEADRNMHKALDDKGTLEQGRSQIMSYLERLENGIAAAIRRKQLKPVT